MGSLSFKSPFDYYILGLWLADNYWSSSAVGLCSTNKVLLSRFRKYLNKICPSLKIRERVYKPKKGSKARIINYHLIKYQQNTYLILTHL